MEFHIVEKKELYKYANGFCELYKTAFKDYMDENTFMRRYYDNPYDDVCMCLAIDNGKIVANYSASPRRVRMQHKVVKCAQSLNTVTDPLYYGKGLFVQLAKLLYKDLEDKGYKFVYGFPNNISNRTFNSKLEWKTIYEIPTLELDLTNLHEIPSTNRGKNIIYRSGIPNKISKKQLSVSKKYEVDKDCSYLQWRYTDTRDKKYHFIQDTNESWAIFKVYGNDIVNVVEICSDNIDGFEELIRWIINYAFRLNLKKLTLWETINTDEHNFLEKVGFRNNYPIYTFGGKLLDSSLSEDIFDYRLWKLQLGDENEY